jgi:16S rRNA (guanine(966)-N(2))-methyltransferase RsmD
MGNWIEETRMLDLFGGTGGVGIECLSRGAAWVDFVDLNRKAVETIQANVRHCGFESQVRVERLDSFAYLQRYHGPPYDLIYVAPPQYQGMWLKALTLVDDKPDLLAKFGSVIVQIHPREESPVTLQRLEEYDRRRYGSVLLLFYAAAEDLAESDADEALALDDKDEVDADVEEDDEDDERY